MEGNLVRRLTTNGQEFSFELNCKREQSLGHVQVDHWWMPVTPLYGQRRGTSSLSQNHLEILRLYWAVVREEQATEVREAQERYLLASIVPDVRAEGSRSIFADAFLRGQELPQRSRDLREFESEILRPAQAARLTRRDFSTRSWQLLGRQEFPDGMQEIYNSLITELLDEPCHQLGQGDDEQAKMSVQETWNYLMRTIGRRAGNQQRKIALDAISYEARAAFHHCYSVAWHYLIYALQRSDSLSPASATFLRFWHSVDADSESQPLFHGHVFGLHPAAGPFIMSQSGQALLGDWISNTDAPESFERLLNGLYLALSHFYRQRQLAAECRPNPNERSTGNVLEIQEIQEQRRRGTRRRRTE